MRLINTVLKKEVNKIKQCGRAGLAVAAKCAAIMNIMLYNGIG